jgi:hypothetical protein
MPSGEPGHLALTAWALARLGHVPPPAWVAALLEESEGRLGGADAQNLANLTWALGTWRCAAGRGRGDSEGTARRRDTPAAAPMCTVRSFTCAGRRPCLPAPRPLSPSAGCPRARCRPRGWRRCGARRRRCCRRRAARASASWLGGSGSCASRRRPPGWTPSSRWRRRAQRRTAARARALRPLQPQTAAPAAAAAAARCRVWRWCTCCGRSACGAAAHRRPRWPRSWPRPRACCSRPARAGRPTTCQCCCGPRRGWGTCPMRPGSTRGSRRPRRRCAAAALRQATR